MKKKTGLLKEETLKMTKINRREKHTCCMCGSTLTSYINEHWCTVSHCRECMCKSDEQW